MLDQSAAAGCLSLKIGLFYRINHVGFCKQASYLGFRTFFQLVGRLDHKTWCFTALGSRGLMYHAYLGAILAQAILKQSSKLIPQEVRISYYNKLETVLEGRFFIIDFSCRSLL